MRPAHVEGFRIFPASAMTRGPLLPQVVERARAATTFQVSLLVTPGKAMPDFTRSRGNHLARMKTYTQSRDADVADETRRRYGLLLAVVAVALVAPGPQVVTVARAMANLPSTAAAVVWAKAHNGHCVIESDLTVGCSKMSGGYTNAATTVGNVWLYGDLGGADRHRHESRHSDQWAMFSGGPLFPVLYGMECFRTHGDFHHNVFEKWAGLHDGGYG